MPKGEMCGTAWWQKNSYPAKQKLIQKLIQGYEFFCHQAISEGDERVKMEVLANRGYDHRGEVRGSGQAKQWSSYT